MIRFTSLCVLTRWIELRSDRHRHWHYRRAWYERPLVLSCRAYLLAMERDRCEPWHISCRAIRPSVKKWSTERWEKVRKAMGAPWKSSSLQRRLGSPLEPVSVRSFSPRGIDLESSSPNVPCTMCRNSADRCRCLCLSYHVPNVEILSVDSSETSHTATDDTSTINIPHPNQSMKWSYLEGDVELSCADDIVLTSRRKTRYGRKTSTVFIGEEMAADES